MDFSGSVCWPYPQGPIEPIAKGVACARLTREHGRFANNGAIRLRWVAPGSLWAAIDDSAKPKQSSVSQAGLAATIVLRKPGTDRARFAVVRVGRAPRTLGTTAQCA